MITPLVSPASPESPSQLEADLADTMKLTLQEEQLILEHPDIFIKKIKEVGSGITNTNVSNKQILEYH